MKTNLCSLGIVGWAALAASMFTPWLGHAATVSVSIKNFAFQPASSSISVGDTVTWTQLDTVPHTSTSDAGVWDSGLLSVNQTFSHTFDAAGTFPYHCTVHPFMTANVTVQGAPTPTPTPTSTITLSVSGVSSATVTLVWSAGDPPFRVQKKTALSDPSWTDALTTTNRTAVVAKDGNTAFYRILEDAPATSP